jgi:hypothetical protein
VVGVSIIIRTGFDQLAHYIVAQSVKGFALNRWTQGSSPTVSQHFSVCLISYFTFCTGLYIFS